MGVLVVRFVAILQGTLAAWLIYDGVCDESGFWVAFGGALATTAVMLCVQAERK